MPSAFNSPDSSCIIDSSKLESHPEFSNIQARYEESFDELLMAKKSQAVDFVLQKEFKNANAVTRSSQFQQHVIERIDNETLREKPFVFLAVNPQYNQNSEN